jgi:hypothetical protein
MRAVHVAETNAIARAEAKQPLLVSRSLGGDGIAKPRSASRGTATVRPTVS